MDEQYLEKVRKCNPQYYDISDKYILNTIDYASWSFGEAMRNFGCAVKDSFKIKKKSDEIHPYEVHIVESDCIDCGSKNPEHVCIYCGGMICNKCAENEFDGNKMCSDCMYLKWCR